MTGSDNHDLTAAHEALWDAAEDGDAARLAALFAAVPRLRTVVDHIHPRSPLAEDPPEPTLQMGNPGTNAIGSRLPGRARSGRTWVRGIRPPSCPCCTQTRA